MGTLELKWGPNGDPKTEKGPHGDRVPQMGTHVGTVVLGPKKIKKAQMSYFDADAELNCIWILI